MTATNSKISSGDPEKPRFNERNGSRRADEARGRTGFRRLSTPWSWTKGRIMTPFRAMGAGRVGDGRTSVWSWEAGTRLLQPGENHPPRRCPARPQSRPGREGDARLSAPAADRRGEVTPLPKRPATLPGGGGPRRGGAPLLARAVPPDLFWPWAARADFSDSPVREQSAKYFARYACGCHTPCGKIVPSSWKQNSNPTPRTTRPPPP